jgi:uncharacterized protein (TIGR04141 family)
MPDDPKWPLRVVQFRAGTNFETAVRSIDRLTRTAPSSDLRLDAAVFAIPPQPGPPRWAPLVESMSADPLPQLQNQLSGAIVLAYYEGRLWGITFGLGHLYLDGDRLESRFGLRTALNLVNPQRLISVGSRVHDDLIVRTNRQASRSTGRGTFTIDDTRDIVGAITGEPLDRSQWGPRISGSSALSLTVPFAAGSFRELLERVNAAHQRDDYKRDFAFIDFIESVRDPEVRSALDEDLVAAVKGAIQSDVYLAPPEIVDYEDVRGFLFQGERRGDEHPELELSSFRDSLDEDEVTLEDLHGRSVRLISESSGLEVRRWSIYKSLVHETTLGDQPYLLSEGEWFAVDASFVDRVNRGIADIPVVNLGLPPARQGEVEGAWNARAALACDLALLDKKEVRFGGTDVEICDLLSPKGELIHVKRKTQSATLSHLVNQGRVSAEALKVDGGVRAAAARRLDDLGRAEAAFFRTDPYSPAAHTVVYAVIAKNAADLPGKLPFFSRLNLWHAARFLASTLDYRVAFTGIPLL